MSFGIFWATIVTGKALAKHYDVEHPCALTYYPKEYRPYAYAIYGYTITYYAVLVFCSLIMMRYFLGKIDGSWSYFFGANLGLFIMTNQIASGLADALMGTEYADE
jgi:hypothetical protein